MFGGALDQKLEWSYVLSTIKNCTHVINKCMGTQLILNLSLCMQYIMLKIEASVAYHLAAKGD